VTRPTLTGHYHCFGRTLLNMEAAGSSETLVRSSTLHGVTSQKNSNLTQFFVQIGCRFHSASCPLRYPGCKAAAA
jgi:hypothetical protein